MNSPNTHLLYCSRMAGPDVVNQIPDIIKTARQFNALHGIFGMLVFDGEVFCQYLEGPSAYVESLIASIQRDIRHVGFTMLMHAPQHTALMFSNWSMAYAFVDDQSFFEPFFALRGDAAMAQFTESQALFDRA